MVHQEARPLAARDLRRILGEVLTVKEITFHLNRILPLIGLLGWTAEVDRILPAGEPCCAMNEVDTVHKKIYTHWNLRHPDMTHSREDCLKNIYHEAVHAYSASLRSVTNDIIYSYVNILAVEDVKKRVEDHLELLVGSLAIAFYNLIERNDVLSA
jgi:hypothetical protein